MARKGRPPAWTRAEREQVLALAQDGVTQRVIAEQVFGDRRYRGRVESILRDEALGRHEVPKLPESTQEIDEAFDARDVSDVTLTCTPPTVPPLATKNRIVE